MSETVRSYGHVLLSQSPIVFLAFGSLWVVQDSNLRPFA